MNGFTRILTPLLALVLLTVWVTPSVVAQSISSNALIATTTLDLSLCGDGLVTANEDCDVPGETGDYSTTIAGRQCDVDCQFGPYCGDGILQTLFDEECDDGNNDNGDFCNAECRIEPAGSGGGGSSGGGSGSSGGSSQELGDTQISVIGQSIPGSRVRILLDAETVGTVTANSSGRFEFATDADPGTVSMGFWTQDDNGVRSITFNTTFDVTQGAITNVSGVIIPPTVAIPDQTLDPGDALIISGQTVPDAQVEIHFNDSEIVETVTANTDGEWSLSYDTSQLSPAEYTIKARTIVGGQTLNSESNFSTSLQLFLGIDGQPSTPADLNRDGFVNLTDFSILIFWWQTNGGESDPPADINGNGNVGLEDFSILLFNWTG